MIHEEYFYNSLLKKYMAIFGTLFNEINIERIDADNKTKAVIRVPLTYAPKDKMMVRLSADPDIDRPAAITLPRMSFEMDNMWYDGERSLGMTNQLYSKDPTDADKVRALANPVAWNLSYRLYIYVKDAEDGTQIIEQIIPFFRPHINVTANLIGDDLHKSIPITLNDISIDDNYTGDFKNRRVLIWQLHFTMQAWFYGPVCKKPIIKFVNLDGLVPGSDMSLCAYSKSDDKTIITTLTTQPGLTANGEPTSDANNSISPHQIFMDDDWGIVQYITDHPEANTA